MYPLRFENIYYEKIWGGKGLEAYRKNVKSSKIGESWDVACRNNGMSIVENGLYKGRNILDLIDTEKELVTGTDIYKSDFLMRDFPLLVKIINTSQKLSVQVHPDDEYALSHEKDNGKVEAWYIVSCEKGAKIVLGTNGCTLDQFITSCSEGTVESYMNEIEVSPGDLFLIRPGMLHSIGAGIVLAEFQKNSDITYRAYDYGRGRELDLKKASEVIDLKLKPEKSKDSIKTEGLNITIVNISGSYSGYGDQGRFHILTVVDGSGTIYYKDGLNINTMEINTLDSIIIPSDMGKYTIRGNLKVVECTP